MAPGRTPRTDWLLRSHPGTYTEDARRSTEVTTRRATCSAELMARAGRGTRLRTFLITL